MNEFIDIYCERIGQGLWVEPLNAMTNAAFFIAAIAAYMLARKENALNWKSALLIILLLCIGTGSTLFHTFATLWAMISDSLPILIYQIVFLILYARFVMGMKCLKSAGLLAIFFALQVAAAQTPREWLNGSIEYFPALIMLTGLATWHVFHAPRDRLALPAAVVIFCISLTFRSIDSAVCTAFPYGTHFLWHCLNGAVLYLTTRGFVLNQTK
ncbi:MAG: hypothetical protein KTR28_03345 [Micavibrio sp.]|nr:hypothetical protein [Micavibrio sp.]